MKSAVMTPGSGPGRGDFQENQHNAAGNSVTMIGKYTPREMLGQKVNKQGNGRKLMSIKAPLSVLALTGCGGPALNVSLH
ncbi:hypothetical protein Baya_13203 [Bagarius yarrelli]|uniref:Uncharacterized protein n=1 Tax=Bagarius yarrelli TaxID=175774 RepID=A0A556V519_BAGYA|nr:hypothetical protein Baya_13203 [Bagarius yarrelli]